MPVSWVKAKSVSYGGVIISLAATLFTLLQTVVAAEGYPEGYETTMKVPLNASVQDVVDVLDREGATSSDPFKEQERAPLLRQLRDSLSKASGPWHLQTNKEAAVKVFDQNANHLLPSFHSRGEGCFLVPSSFRCLADAFIYAQVFQKNPQACFSQYALSCENLPPSLRLFGMSQMWIVFASFDGEPPRSCIVAYANPRYPDSIRNLPTIPILRKRYGRPKLHFNISETCPEAVCKLDSLRKLLPSPRRDGRGEAIWNPTFLMASPAASSNSIPPRPRTRGNSIWGQLVTTGCANDDYGDGILAFPFFLPRPGGMCAMAAPGDNPVSLPCPPSVSAGGHCTVDFTLEWRLGSTRILVSGVEFLGALCSVHYVYYPAFLRLQPIYSKLDEEVKRQQEIEVREASRRFPRL